MTRAVLSMLASALIVVGAALGWTSGDRIVAEAGQAARDVGAELGLGTASPAPGTPGATAGARPGAPGSARTASRTAPEGAGGRPGADTDSARPTEASSGTSATSPLRPSRSCRTPAPTTATALNTIFRGLGDEPMLQGADHGESVLLADGRRFFAFGDTVRDDTVAPGLWTVNSVMVLDQGCIRVMTAPDQGAAIPGRGDVGYWPMSMRAVPTSSGTEVQMLATRVRKTGQDEFDSLGPTYVVFTVPAGGMPRLTQVRDLGPDRRDPTYPTWGAAMWESGGHLYLFGTASNATKTTFGWSMHVARTRPGALADPAAWEYWDGSTWRRGTGREATTAAGTLIPADGGVSHILSVFSRGGSWYAVSKEGDFFGDNLAVWKAPAPTGPWTKHVIAPLKNDDLLRRYSPQAHPDFPTADGRLLVSYSQGPWQSRYFRSNPEMYRPQFLEITLP